MKDNIVIDITDCSACSIGSYIQETFYDNEGNDAICNLCDKKEEE